MKKLLLYVIIYFISMSCATTKKNYVANNKINNSLNIQELNIVNDILEIELESDRFKKYKKQELILIEEMGAQLESILTYEYAFKNWHSFGTKSTKEDNERFGWILDTLQIRENKEELFKSENIIWNISDFKKYKIKLITRNNLKEQTNNGKFLKEPEKLILRFNRPLLLDEKKAFVSFRISSSHFGKSISKGTVLMIKKNNKWIIKNSYDDGVFE